MCPRCLAPAPTGRNGQRQLATVFKSGIFFSAFLSIALTRPLHRGCLVVPSGDYSHGQAPATRPDFVKGDGQKTHSRSEKKDYENYITKKQLRAREQIRTVDQRHRTCHRAEQNRPEVSDSKPATLKCGIHIISGFSIKGFSLRVKTSRTGQRAL